MSAHNDTALPPLDMNEQDYAKAAEARCSHGLYVYHHAQIHCRERQLSDALQALANAESKLAQVERECGEEGEEACDRIGNLETQCTLLYEDCETWRRSGEKQLARAEAVEAKLAEVEFQRDHAAKMANDEYKRAELAEEKLRSLEVEPWWLP